jgi:hypothetical protein
MDPFRTSLGVESNYVNHNGIWYSKVRVNPFEMRYQMVGTTNYVNSGMVVRPKCYDPSPPRRLTNEQIISFLNDELYKSSVKPDCGCYNYEKSRKYPAIKPGNCNSNPGCSRITISIRDLPARLPISDDNVSEEDQILFHDQVDGNGLDIEDNMVSNVARRLFEEPEEKREEFRTPCGQIYWVDSDHYLYTTKTVEFPIAYWVSEHQCVQLYMDDSDESDFEDDGTEPPPTPPPMYEDNSNNN